MAKMFWRVEKKNFSILVFRVLFKVSRRQRATPRLGVGCDAQVAKLTGVTPQLPKSCHPTENPEEGVSRLPVPQGAAPLFLHS